MRNSKTKRKTPYSLFRKPKTKNEAKQVGRYVDELKELGFTPSVLDELKTKPVATSWDDINFSLSKQEYLQSLKKK